MTVQNALPVGTSVRLVRPGDAVALATVLADSREHLAGSFPTRWERLSDRCEQHDRIVKALAGHEAGSQWPGVIVEDSADLVVGRVALHDIALGNRRSCFLSYWLAGSAVGQGHATRAVTQVLAIAFSELRLHRVDAFVRPDNTASLAVLARCGFHRIGVAPRHTFVGEDWADEVLLQKLAPWDAPGVLEP